MKGPQASTIDALSQPPMSGSFRGRVLQVHPPEQILTVALGPTESTPEQNEFGEAKCLPVSVVSVTCHSADQVQIGDFVWVHAESGALLGHARRTAEGPWPAPESDWARHCGSHRGVAPAVVQRAALNRAIREYFQRDMFLEVETPLIARSPGLETHLEAVQALLRPTPAPQIESRWLVTSPEYHMKRLLSAGYERIYQLGRAFRSSEAGAIHNPEFTMLEWYRAWDVWPSLVADIVALLRAAVDAAGPKASESAHQAAHAPPLSITFEDAMERWAGFSARPWSCPAALWERARAAGVGIDERDRHDATAIFCRALVEKVEPSLPANRLVVLHSWPDCMASLAERNQVDSTLAERFEVYVGGMELANGFTELTCPKEQLRRFEYDLAERKKLGLPVYPVDLRFLGALQEGCPPAAGVALGVDRLLMFVLGYKDIAQVLAFPFSLA